MNYIIFIVVALTLIWAYHRYKYHNSGYQVFEYYLSDNSFKDIILVWDNILKICLIIGIILLGGKLVEYFFNIK